MASVDVNALLSMVEHMDVVLDRHFAGSARSSETIADVLDICEQMRAKKRDAATRDSLEVIERRVREIGNVRAEDNGLSALFKRFMSTQLLVDIHNLRRQLLAIERAECDRRTSFVHSWLTRFHLPRRAPIGDENSVKKKNTARWPV